MITSGTEPSVMSRHLHGLFIRHGCMLLLHCFSVKGMQRTCVVCSFAEENADESMIEKVQCGWCSR
ncbi:unnamed protein product, partial [Gadus morhua 'NCC']